MVAIVVKHFKRSGVGFDDKELVTEIVVESSDTGRFLQRVKESRLTRPCFQSIDMRGRVAGECHRYAFNDRVHYLDEFSFRLFEQGLREHNGVYTVGTFEAIMRRAHARQAQPAMHEASERRRGEVERRRLQRARTVSSETADVLERETALRAGDAVSPVIENPQLLPLGYFRRRGQPRL